MKFFKYHALGNDYLIIRSYDDGERLSADQIIRLCHRHLGVGADGVVLQLPKTESGQFPVRFFNPDGSEVGHSGNGLRIVARCLWDQVQVDEKPFIVTVEGSEFECRVHNGGLEVTVDMGAVSFKSDDIPLTGPTREALHESIDIDGISHRFSAASIGNPHAVLVQEKISREKTIRLGPLLENHECFPKKANVLCMEVKNRKRLQVEIWERGTGYILASGTGASVAAAVGKRLNLCDSEVVVQMPGGDLEISVDDAYRVRMTGQVTRVAEGEIYEEMFFWRS